MIDIVSMLLLIAAEPETSGIPVIKVDASMAEATAAYREAEAAAARMPHPKISNPMMDLTPDDYPAESLKADEEGTVRIAVEVDVAGKATGCTVLQTSGHSRLDERTCQVAMERARFQPARDEAGKAVASVWRSSPIRWKIPIIDYVTLPRTESYVATTIQIAADGTIGKCTVESVGNMMMPDACEQAKLRNAKKAKEASRWWKSLTDVIITSNKDIPPNISKPEWGTRASRLVSAQMKYEGMSHPIACETIMTEGWTLGGDACPPPEKLAPTPPNPDWSKARADYVEFSTFGQLR